MPCFFQVRNVSFRGEKKQIPKSQVVEPLNFRFFRMFALNRTANSHDKLDKALKGYKEVADKAVWPNLFFLRFLRVPGWYPRALGGGTLGNPKRLSRVRGLNDLGFFCGEKVRGDEEFR